VKLCPLGWRVTRNEASEEATEGATEAMR
jgi:hypothetical protein